LLVVVVAHLVVVSYVACEQQFNNPTYEPQATSGILDPSSKNIKLWTKAHFPFLEVA
jgi:hypothetical protein